MKATWRGLLLVGLVGCAQPQGIVESELPPAPPTPTPEATPEPAAAAAVARPAEPEPEPTPMLPGPSSDVMIGQWALEVSELDQQRLDGARRMAEEGDPRRLEVLANLERALSMRMTIGADKLILSGGPAGDGEFPRGLVVVEEQADELTVELTSRRGQQVQAERLTLGFDGPDRLEMSPEGTYDPLRFVRR